MNRIIWKNGQISKIFIGKTDKNSKKYLEKRTKSGILCRRIREKKGDPKYAVQSNEKENRSFLQKRRKSGTYDYWGKTGWEDLLYP